MTDKRQSALRKSLPVMPSCLTSLTLLLLFRGFIRNILQLRLVEFWRSQAVFLLCRFTQSTQIHLDHDEAVSLRQRARLWCYHYQRAAPCFHSPLRVFENRASLSVLLKMPFQPVIAEWLVSCAGALSVGAQALTCWLAAAADACISTQWYDGHWHLS